jgi:ATP-dependent RNA helicase DDX56/DBP9
MAEDTLLDHIQTFSSFSHILDARILRALAEQGFARPTLVQAKAIPLALEGRDILARARTGSGKTAAYCVPIVQKILNAKSVSPLSRGFLGLKCIQSISAADLSKQATRAMILVPTRELAEQVSNYLKTLLKYCEGITSVNIATGATTHLQRCVDLAFES